MSQADIGIFGSSRQKGKCKGLGARGSKEDGFIYINVAGSSS